MNDQTIFGYAVLDIDSNSIVTTDEAHWRVHKGQMWYVYHYASVALNGNLDILFIAPAAPINAHIVYDFVHADDVELFIYQDVVVSANGTALTRWNMEHSQSTNGTALTAFHTPTVTGVGTERFHRYFPGSKNEGHSRDGDEEHLNPGSKYLYRFTSRGAANPISPKFDWYEVSEAR